METRYPGEDIERLRALAMLHYVVAGVVLAFALLPLGFVAIGLAVLVFPRSLATGANELPPFVFGLMFLAMGLGLVLYGLVLAIALIVSGHCLRKQRHYWFSVVVACGALTFTPLGTLLGVATLVVLLQTTVRELYGITLDTMS